jgi:hypothetical protein
MGSNFKKSFILIAICFFSYNYCKPLGHYFVHFKKHIKKYKNDYIALGILLTVYSGLLFKEYKNIEKEKILTFFKKSNVVCEKIINDNFTFNFSKLNFDEIYKLKDEINKVCKSWYVPLPLKLILAICYYELNHEQIEESYNFIAYYQ